MNTKKSGFKWSYLILLVVVILLCVFIFVDKGKPGEKITESAAIEMISENKIEAIYCRDGMAKIRIVGSKIDEKEFPINSDYYFNYTSTSLDIVLEAVNKHNEQNPVKKVAWTVEPNSTSVFDIIMPILYLGFGIFIIFFVFKMLSSNSKGAMSFGKNKARQTSNIKVRFSDIAGADEEKQELQEIVEFLKNPQKFTDLGARIPKGVLLVGNPGTGKTLLARAVAGESNVPFLSISGSDFVEMFVGVGASRVRDLFEQAKKSMPCIVFIDEIDAVGRQRGTGLGGGNDEREQTLNQLLVEMDGFEANDGIIILAATNRSDVLDPALMRPGRFDRQIYVHIPDVKGREGIIKIHAKNKPMSDDVDYTTLAKITSGFTGADIENMLNEAAILAARANRPRILMTDITEGINKVVMGPQKKSRLVTEEDRKITAYHEAGHALLHKKLRYCDDVQEVSIISRGMAAGYTMSRPNNDDNHLSINKINDEIASMMGGRIAEELVIKDITTGASHDIARATELARNMVEKWGMSKFGFMCLSSEDQVFIGRDYQTKNNFSDKTAAEADMEIQSILTENYKRAKKIVAENIEMLHEMSKLLLEKETIYKEEVDMILEGKKTEEIIALMEVKEKERKDKEAKEKDNFEKMRKLKEYQKKVETGAMFEKNGIISKEEYQKIKEEYEVLSKEIIKKESSEKQETTTETLSEVKKTEEVQVNAEKKPRAKKEPKLKKEDKKDGE